MNQLAKLPNVNDLGTNQRPDQELVDIAQYVVSGEPRSNEAYQTARHCFMDTLGCGLLALRFPDCAKLLGPVVPGTQVPDPVRVPGTPFLLDPVKAAWDIGCMVRWLDFNDTWLAAEWGHPSDNLGGILAVCDYVTQQRRKAGEPPLLMRDVLTAMIKAHEIQGCLALENSFNRVGLDHVLLVRVATTAVVTHILGGNTAQIVDALSHAWIDGSALRTYRHAPNTGSRKSWAAGDASSRAVQLALLVLKGEMGYPTALSAPTWGFYDTSFNGERFKFSQPYGTYVMENVLFKLSFPAEFHAQTAVEAAITLHPQVVDRIDEIESIQIRTHESAIRIIDKTGPLNNPADRDHCLQYMIAIGLLKGGLTADDYEDNAAADPRIDELRDLMQVEEDPSYSADYLDPEKRSIANAIQVHFSDGTHSDWVAVEYPIGHRRRRKEGIPVLKQKFQNNLATRYHTAKAAEIFELCDDAVAFEETPVDVFMQQLSLP